MTDYTIINTEQMDDVVKIEVEVQGDQKFYVDKVLQDPASATDEYIDTLKQEGRDFDLHSSLNIHTLFLPDGYTQGELDAEIQALMLDANNSEFDELGGHGPVIEEKLYSNGLYTKNTYQIDNAPEDVVNQLTSTFPNVDLSAIDLISTPSFHEVLQEDVITVALFEWGLISQEPNESPLLTKCRKYCMSQAGHYDREYIYSTETYSFLPSEATVIGRSRNINPTAGLVLPDFYDVYFACDPDVAEAHFDLDELRGEFATYYAVTVVNDAVARVKQYVYDSEPTFSDWLEVKQRVEEANGLS